MTLKDRVQSMIRRLDREDVNMHGLILTVEGVRKAEATYAPFREGQPHRMYSVSKTMTGLAIGMLAEDGKLSLDQRITEFFPDLLPKRPDPRVMRQTVRDMLRMATCYRETAYREGVDEDWTRPFFTGVPTHEPGTVFHYDTGASQVLAALVRRLSGQEVIDFLEDRLFTPLGLRDERFWLRDPSGCCQGGTGLCMSLRDLDTVAQCLLEGGKGLVPEGYVREMQKKQIITPQRTADEERYGYGWQCWMTRAGWSMYGLGGQLCVVCPEKNTVLSTVADTRLDDFGVQKIYDAFFEEVYPHIGREDMEPERFSLTVRLLENEPSFAAPPSGSFRFEAGNPLGLKHLRLEGQTLIYEQLRGEVRLPFRPGAYLETEYPGWPGIPAVVTAGWQEPGALRLRCHAAGTAPCGFEMLLCFREESVTVQCMRSRDPVTEGYEGVATGKQNP